MTIFAESSLLPRSKSGRAPVASVQGAWFVALCMVVIASSLGVVLYTQASFTLGEAGWASVACLLTMVLGEFYTARMREKAQFERELMQIAQATQDMAREVGMLGARIDDTEKLVGTRIRETVDARLGVLLDEMSSIQSLLRDLGEEVKEVKEAQAELQTRVDTPPPRQAVSFQPPYAAPAPEQPHAAPAPEQQRRPASLEPREPASVQRAPADAATTRTIVYALRNEQVDVHLQVIVGLPQRRAAHYEALARLRGAHGETLLPAQFLASAKESGLLPPLDAAVVRKCLKAAEQMARRDRPSSIFCNIDPSSLRGSPAVTLVNAVEERREQAPHIVFEMSAEAFEGLGAVESETMEALAELGCRFCLDNLTRLSVDGPRLASRYVRFLKVDADVLVDPHVESGDIHPTDFARLMARSGIEVIATRVESEPQVLDMLDFDLSLAQGYLFGRPRPVRLTGMAAERAAG